ncbi:hypothetical protein HPB48_023031 [Haemaphysalis longicornis]|uniref:DH domain-containing protein n=1 Tax=Haemaphysalis longicornis TaxID=44386 RepID=A0A9J6GID4_HAELO|nr:hypothetical protein HPB48_023031 [Haemaphysalis longicornis]
MRSGLTKCLCVSVTRDALFKVEIKLVIPAPHFRLVRVAHEPLGQTISVIPVAWASPQRHHFPFTALRTFANIDQRLEGAGALGCSFSESAVPADPSCRTPPPHKDERECLESTQDASTPSEAEMLTMCKCIVSSIIESETAYVDCLDTLNQYARALTSAIGTNQSVLSKEEIETIFYKIEQLHDTHKNFRDGLRRNCENWDAKPTIGENFKFLVRIPLSQLPTMAD